MGTSRRRSLRRGLVVVVPLLLGLPLLYLETDLFRNVSSVTGARPEWNRLDLVGGEASLDDVRLLWCAREDGIAKWATTNGSWRGFPNYYCSQAVFASKAGMPVCGADWFRDNWWETNDLKLGWQTESCAIEVRDPSGKLVSGAISGAALASLFEKCVSMTESHSDHDSLK